MLTYHGRNRQTINYLKAVAFDFPEWTPCRVSLMPATWIKYRDALEELVLAHPRLFPGYVRGSKDFDLLENPLYQPGQRKDCWGTVWENTEPGLDSYPIRYPLADWQAWGTYRPPAPLLEDMFAQRDWGMVQKGFEEARARGDLVVGGGLWHGFMYMRLFYLRGFENLMMDMATGDPRLWQIIDMVEGYNTTVIQRMLELGAEFMSFGDDLGLQASLPVSPRTWKQYIKPSYIRMFGLCKNAGALVYLHTDGHILEIIPDLIEAGVRVLNPQIRANGLEGLKEFAKGRVAIDQDLDRQLFPFATPGQIEDHIGEIFEALRLPQGGLMLYAECEPDVPLANIEAICKALEKFCHPPELAEDNRW
jgi:uroporphyrinogen decarboxylase